MKARPAGVLVFVLAVVLFANSSAVASLASPASLPSPDALPANVVGFVSHVPPQSQAITASELGRAITQTAAQSNLKVPTPGEPRYERIEEEAFGDLLEGLWIQGQAAEMGVFVTDPEVTAELTRIKEESFKTKRQFHSYLEHSHLTMRDARYRVKLQLLGTKIQNRASRGAHSAAEALKKFSTFVDTYEKRWRSRTVCAPPYAIERCSNGAQSQT